MSEVKVYPVPTEIAAHAHINEAQYQSMYERSVRTPRGSGARRRTSSSLVQEVGQGLAVGLHGRHRHQVVRRRQAQRLVQLPGPPPRDAGRPGRHHLGGQRAERLSKHITYRELHEQVCEVRERAEDPRRQEGRPGLHLPADDPRGRRRDAGLRAHRRDPLGGLRRLLAGLPARPHPGLRLPDADHRPTSRLRGGNNVPLKTNADEALKQCPERQELHRGAAHRRQGQLVEGRDIW